MLYHSKTIIKTKSFITHNRVITGKKIIIIKEIPMPSVTNKGGHIYQSLDTKNYAGVDEAKGTKTLANTATWVLTLKDVPTKTNFIPGQSLTYNSKGTNNHNADNILNILTVTSVNGPAKYTCSGNWPINI